MEKFKHGDIAYHKLTGTALIVVTDEFDDYTKSDGRKSDEIYCRYMDYAGRFQLTKFDRIELTRTNPNDINKPAKEVKV